MYLIVKTVLYLLYTEPCLDRHEERIAALTNQVATLQASIRQKDALISNLTDEVESLRASITVLREEGADKDRRLAGMSALRTQNVGLTAQVTAHRSTITDLRNRNAILDESLGAARDESKGKLSLT